jgi:hypothetical protein
VRSRLTRGEYEPDRLNSEDDGEGGCGELDAAPREAAVPADQESDAGAERDHAAIVVSMTFAPGE